MAPVGMGTPQPKEVVVKAGQGASKTSRDSASALLTPPLSEISLTECDTDLSCVPYIPVLSDQGALEGWPSSLAGSEREGHHTHPIVQMVG